MRTSRPDLEALLVALVLVPGTYSRNRFFSLYTDPEAARVRRRAQNLRSVIVEITQGDPTRRGHLVTIDEQDDGEATITYVVPSLNLRRTTTITKLELAIVRYALARREGAPLTDDDPIRRSIEQTLCHLSPELAALAANAPSEPDSPDLDDEPPPDPGGHSSLPGEATER